MAAPSNTVHRQVVVRRRSGGNRCQHRLDWLRCRGNEGGRVGEIGARSRIWGEEIRGESGVAFILRVSGGCHSIPVLDLRVMYRYRL